MARLFVSQEQMDRWTSEGKVRLDHDLMTVPALQRSFRLRTAILFTKVVDGADQHGLVGRVKSDLQLNELRAEQYGSSVIVGDVAYEGVEGFLGTPDESSAGGASGLLNLNRGG
jgi:hypothetical protein